RAGARPMARRRARRDDRASRPAAALLAHPRGGSAPESAPGDRKEARRRLSRISGLHLLRARSLHGPRPLPPVSAGTAVRRRRRAARRGRRGPEGPHLVGALMIAELVGTAGTGKSTLSQRLARGPGVMRASVWKLPRGWWLLNAVRSLPTLLALCLRTRAL